jgi:hypothetical protein
VVVAVGAHQVGQELGVTGIRLGARGRVAIAVAAGRQGVDAVDPVAGADQRVDEQAVVDLDPDDHPGRLLGVIGQQRVQLGEPGDADRTTQAAKHLSGLVHHQHVVVGLGPVDAHEDHRLLPSDRRHAPGPRRPAAT